jgi:NitT/TauT family transport system permease protein
VTIFKISPIVLVKPTQILPVIINNVPLLLSELGITMTEAFFGWLIGSSIALLTTSVIFSFKKVTKIITSFSIVVNAVPLIALSAILGGFIGTDQNAKTVIVALLCYFPILIVSLTAFTTIDENFMTLFKTYNSSPLQRFFKLIIPHSLPAIFTSLRINVVLAMTTAIVSEYFGAHGGIGQFILSRKGFYDLPMVWAAIFFTVLGGTLFYSIIGLIQKKFIYHVA